jgi:hypothetical protein
LFSCRALMVPVGGESRNDFCKESIAIIPSASVFNKYYSHLNSQPSKVAALVEVPALPLAPLAAAAPPVPASLILDRHRSSCIDLINGGSSCAKHSVITYMYIAQYKHFSPASFLTEWSCREQMAPAARSLEMTSIRY